MRWYWRRRRNQSFGFWASESVGLDDSGRPVWNPNSCTDEDVERVAKEIAAEWFKFHASPPPMFPTDGLTPDDARRMARAAFSTFLDQGDLGPDGV